MRLAGRVLDANHSNYAPIFLVCGAIYLAALWIFQLLVPRMGEGGSDRTSETEPGALTYGMIESFQLVSRCKAFSST